MIPSNFNYHNPTKLSEVFSLLDEFSGQAKVLAGGHSLLPMMKFRFSEPKHLVDLGGVEILKGISINENDIIIGAMSSENDLLRFPDMEVLCPLLYKAVLLIADPQIRNRGTIGGDIAHGDPGNDQPSVMLALDASFKLETAKESRIVKADDFFIGTYQTILKEQELLTQIIIPNNQAKKRHGFRKLKRKTGDFATAACALTLNLANGQCNDVRIALTNLGPKSFRAHKAEWLLNNHALNEETINAAIILAMKDCEPAKDQRGDTDYKTSMAGEMLKRALQDATS
jgi:carbon-monoxide dehydrogenase medium subunit